MKTEEIIRDFVEYLQGQYCRAPHYAQNVSLMALEITNNSANDYFRNPTSEEVEKLIFGYLLRDREREIEESKTGIPQFFIKPNPQRPPDGYQPDGYKILPGVMAQCCPYRYEGYQSVEPRDIKIDTEGLRELLENPVPKPVRPPNIEMVEKDPVGEAIEALIKEVAEKFSRAFKK